jgi:hypothetical protein
VPEEVDLGRYRPVSSDFEFYRRLAAEPTGPEEPAIPGFITEEQFARQMYVTLSTVRRWKRRGYGPKFFKIGRKDYCKETGASDFAAKLLAEAEQRDRPRRRR